MAKQDVKKTDEAKSDRQIKKRKHLWLPICNTILIIVVVVSLGLMIISELVLDNPAATFAGFNLKTGAGESIVVSKAGNDVLQIPFAAKAAGYVNSIPGYVTVIFPPCVLLVVLQVIASGLDKKDAQEEQEAKTEQEEPDEEKQDEPVKERVSQDTGRVKRPAMQKTPAHDLDEMLDETAPKGQETPQVQELLEDIEQLKAALQQSQNQNEELRVRAVQAIKKAREQQPVVYAQQPYMQMPPQMPPQIPYTSYPVYPPVYSQQPYGAYYPPQMPQQPYYPAQMPPQGGYYTYPPQQGPMQ